jgi:hypothetical protein
MHALLTTPSTTMRTVMPAVADRLLGEIPRFFDGSVETMLRELFQNAFRADAQTVSVTVDSARRTLTIQDDGCGIYDPQLVLTAGATGWENVIEPAGLGLFSLLANNVLKVVIASWREHAKPWRMTLTQEQLRRVPAVIEELPVSAINTASGTLVEITFANVLMVDPVAQMVQRARSLYPFGVVLNLDGQLQEIAPYRSWEPEVTLKVPGIGTLEWTLEKTSAYTEVVWMHQAFCALNFRRALSKIQEENPASKIFDRALRWIVDPQCGVRPKLPDRNDLIEDVQLTQAVQQIANALTEHLLHLAEEHTRTQDVLTLDYRFKYALGAPGNWKYYVEDEVDSATLNALQNFPTWLRDPDILAAVLTQLGWVENERRRYEKYAVYLNDENEVICDEDKRQRIYRSLPAVSSKAVAFTLTQLGRPTHWDPRAEAGRVRIKKLRIHPKSPQVALCESIQVEGIGEMPYLLSEDGFADERDGFELAVQERRGKKGYTYLVSHCPCILFAGTALQFKEWLEKNADWVLNFIAVAQMERDSIWDYDWIGDDELQPARVRRSVLAEVGVFDQKFSQVHQKRADAQDARGLLAEIDSQMAQLVYFAKKPYLRRVLRGVPSLRKQLRALGQNLEPLTKE